MHKSYENVALRMKKKQKGGVSTAIDKRQTGGVTNRLARGYRSINWVQGAGQHFH